MAKLIVYIFAPSMKTVPRETTAGHCILTVARIELNFHVVNTEL